MTGVNHSARQGSVLGSCLWSVFLLWMKVVWGVSWVLWSWRACSLGHNFKWPGLLCQCGLRLIIGIIVLYALQA